MEMRDILSAACTNVISSTADSVYLQHLLCSMLLIKDMNVQVCDATTAKQVTKSRAHNSSYNSRRKEHENIVVNQLVPESLRTC